jgi:GNAT superfamily N-acetyltransferase
LEVAKPQQLGRYILTEFRPTALLSLINRIDESAVYIKFPGSVEQALPILPSGWSIRDDAYLMRCRLSSQAAGYEIPDGYDCRVENNAGAASLILATHSGDRVGFGCYAMVEDFAVLDQISVEPAHQRRGLGRAIVSRLMQSAAGRSASHGVLVATEEGRRLYSAMGWQQITRITSMISHIEQASVARCGAESTVPAQR